MEGVEFEKVPVLLRRGSQVVRQGSAKAPSVGSIPTLASIFKMLVFSGLAAAGRRLSVKLSVRWSRF